MTPLAADVLQTGCRANRWIGREIAVLAETASTNDVCHEIARCGPEQSGTVVFAERQTAGRGKQGSTWQAPAQSSLLFSVLLFPRPRLDQPPFLTAWSALAIAGELRERLGLDARIKWPNDVRIGGCKLCGILVERRIGTVVGIGLNVAIERRQFPPELRASATSLVIETGGQIDRTKLAVGLLRRLDVLFDQAMREGPEALFDAWTTYVEDYGVAPVAAVTRQTQIIGRLLELRPDCGARIARSDGCIARIPPQELLRIEPVEANEVVHAHR
jgi:BirA family biotin operon repressor/biotin-[acetyl-CoA-carboxylase] ligase